MLRIVNPLIDTTDSDSAISMFGNKLSPEYNLGQFKLMQNSL